jgi:pimeloyl-ACP methyl ester carboxylesterase
MTPTLFKPIAMAARVGPLAKDGPRVAASRRLMLRGLTAGHRDPGRLPLDVVDAYYGPVFGTPESSRAFARRVAAISSADLAAVRPQLAQFKVPTLIVWGTGDLFFPLRWARRLADLILGTTPQSFTGLPINDLQTRVILTNTQEIMAVALQ